MSIADVEYEYVVLKINGYDVSHLSRYEAVQKFLQAKETFVVELCRQKNNALDLELKQGSNAKISKLDKPEELSVLTENSAEATIRTASASQDKNGHPSTPLKEIETKIPLVLTLRARSHDDRLGGPQAASKETQTQTIVDTDVLKDSDLVHTITDNFIEHEHHLFEQCLEPEIDIEEVTLIKGVEHSRSNQIGLIVTSSGLQQSSIDTNKGEILRNNAEQSEDVFISGVQPESIAYRDGRLRQGDQILRINGLDVKNQEEFETQIAGSGTSVTLLVSRILYPEDDDDEDIHFEYANTFLPDDYTNVVDKLDKVLLTRVQSMEELSHESAMQSDKCYHIPSEQNSSDSNGKISLPKNIIEQSTKSCSKIKLRPNANFDYRKSVNQSLSQNEVHLQYEYDESEHIYETIPEYSESEPLYCSPYQRSNGKTSIDSCSSTIASRTVETLETTMQQQTQRVAQWLGLKPQYPRTRHTLVGRPPPLKLVQQPTCSRIFTLRSTLTNTSGSNSSGVAYSAYGTNNVVIGNPSAPGEEVDNSSSAYNTGGSNNSVSPHQNTTNPDDGIATGRKLESTAINGHNDSLQSTAVSSMLLLPFGKSGRIGLCSSNLPTAYVSEGKHNVGFENENNPLKSDIEILRVKQTEDSYSHCPQFNAPNLSSYHFVSSQEVANRCHISTSLQQNSSLLNGESGEDIPMVWKVKRRPDGTRYIVKRPVRNRPQVAIRKNMRCNEFTTTEEDTVSEVKIGRYWTKEERKRHIERARERRHHQTQPHQQ
ncbi:slo-interacting protein 1 isoform X3 [Drosophila teissieri]|uniref:slo-interacting protein 1 isoform X3 n=1 Tax=Drosophila teissieri TaxID=7243 RepID=UPI001CB9D944|nr:slo-interacting protein 1 isoform X3 [Drosophila teissieri]